MARIIAIDTALSACSVALGDHGAVTVLCEPKPREHIRLVLPMIDELLSNGGLSVHDLDAIAFSQGPGSFTGLRIGTGVVQGLAFGAVIPVIPVSTLRVMAQAVIDSQLLALNESVMPIIDARMGDVYWGLYRNVQRRATTVVDDAVSRPCDVGTDALGFATAEQISAGVAAGVGDGWQFRSEIPVHPMLIKEQVAAGAEQVLILAIDAFSRGDTIPVEQVEPLYLRDKVSWKKRERLRR